MTLEPSQLKCPCFLEMMSPYPKGLHFLEPAHIAEPLFGLHAPSLSVSGMAGNVSAAARQKKDFHSSSASPGASRYLLPPPQLIFTLLHHSAARGKDKLSCSSYPDLADCRVILKVTTPAIIPFPHLNCYSLWRRPPGAPPGPLLAHIF